MSTEISMVRNAHSTECRSVGLDQFLLGIRTGRWAERVAAVRAVEDEEVQKRMKEELPGGLIAGLFSYRKADCLLERSGFLVLDFDKSVDVAALRAIVDADPHTFASFASVRGKGLKVVVRVPTGPDHKVCFAAAKARFERLSGLEIDSSGSDVSRICFVSHDPTLYRNDNAVELSVEEPPAAEPAPAAGPPGPEPDGNDEPRIRDALSRIDADDRAVWIEMGMALHSWDPGARGMAVWDAWSATSTKYKDGEIPRKWAGFRRSGVTLGSLFFRAKENGWTNTAGRRPPGDAGASDESPAPEAPAVGYDYGPAIIGDGNRQTINQYHFAARYVAESGVIHDPAVRRFYSYEPATGLWRHQTDEVTVRELSRCFQRIVIGEQFAHFLAKRTANLLHGLRDLSRGLAERRDVFNRRRSVIHVANGMLVIDAAGKTELQPFAADWYSRNRSEIAWNPGAACPRFKEQLLLAAMSEEDVNLIQRYFGQCILGMNLSQTFLVLRGTPGGGKSTLANIIEGVIGRHNVTELRIAQLSERFELVRYVGRTLLSGKDVPGDFLNMKPAHVLKALVGGDTLEGEVKHGNESFSLEGRFNVMISTNTRLRVKLDSDAGAWRRRMLIVDYLRPKPAKPIPGLDAILLREEGEGILHWAVEGAIRLINELETFGTIQMTDTQRRRVDDLLSESDSVRSFVRECVVARSGGEIAVTEMTAAYRDFCDAREWEPLRERQFQAELPDAMLEYHRAVRRNDIRRDGKAARGYRGVALKTIFAEPSAEPDAGGDAPFSEDSGDLF